MTKSIGVILASEVGSTETRLALCGLDMGRPVLVVEERVSNDGAPSLGAIVHRFVKKHQPPQLRGAAFAVAGPVHEGVCLAANLPWSIEASALAAELSMDHVTLLNDVDAIAHAIQTLAHGDLMTVHAGDPPDHGNQAVISAGACPGTAGLFWNGTEHRCFVSEAGHADFAPNNEAELALAGELQSQVARVTVELLLSGAGLLLIHRFICNRAGHVPSVSFDAHAVVARSAMKDGDPLCRSAVDMFLSIYGSAAGNLALTLRAVGGVYLAGGMVTVLRDQLRSGVFHAAFSRKAPMHDLLGRIPVHAIVNDQAALIGAATVALRDLRVHRGGGWAS